MYFLTVDEQTNHKRLVGVDKAGVKGTLERRLYTSTPRGVAPERHRDGTRKILVLTRYCHQGCVQIDDKIIAVSKFLYSMSNGT